MARSKRIDCAENIDPSRVDLADKHNRRRKPVTRKREPMPDWLKPWAEAAAKRMLDRPASPGIIAEPSGVGEDCQLSLVSPHADENAWWEMLGDAFGTRSMGVIQTFIDHLSELTAPSYDHTNECWKPNERQLNAALAILHASRPQNEIDAMLAANAVALHWMQMKAASGVLKTNLVDGRTAAASASLARAFVSTVEAMDRRKRRKRASRQIITVKRDTHHHQHKHVHLQGGGVKIGGQPDATERELLAQAIERTAIPAGCTPLPGPRAHNRRDVPSESGAGEAGVPDARRRKGRGRAERQS